MVNLVVGMVVKQYNTDEAGGDSRHLHFDFYTPSVLATEGVLFSPIPLVNQADTNQTTSRLVKVRQATKTAFLDANGGEMVVGFLVNEASRFISRGFFYSNCG